MLLSCPVEFYKHSYSILLLLSSDFYNLAPRGIKSLILYEIACMGVIYIKFICSGYTAICFVVK
jgi:hypothetical protein